MSAPDPWTRGLTKITALNRFLQSEAAGIKLGEDAQDLNNRLCHRSLDSGRAASRSPPSRSSGSSPDCVRWHTEAYDFRKGSISSDYSCNSSASHNSSDSPVSRNASGSSSISSGSYSRRASDYRRVPYAIPEFARPSNQHRLSSVAGVADIEVEDTSEFSFQCSESSQPYILSPFRRTTTADSVFSDDMQATDLTDCTQLDPGTDFPTREAHFFHRNFRPSDLANRNADPAGTIYTSPLSSPGLVVPDLSIHDSTLVTRYRTLPFTPANMPPDVSCHASLPEKAMEDGEEEIPSKSPSQRQVDTDASHHRSESDASRVSNEDPPTPTSGSGKSNSDEAPSDHDESDSSPDHATKTIQQELLEEILGPVKHQLIGRLMVYISGVTKLRDLLPLMPARRSIEAVAAENSSALINSCYEDEEFTPTPSDSIKTAISSTSGHGSAQRTRPTSGQRSSASRSCGRNTGQTTAGGVLGSKAGNKRSLNGTPSQLDNDDEDADDDEKKFHTQKRRKPSAPPSKLRIACPYYVRQPGRTPKADSCFRSGFGDITKMKEHLDRVHNNSVQCQRCFEVFSEDRELSEHLRASGPDLCQLAQERPELDGYDREQGDKLSDRMRGLSIIEKWTAIWKILFPHDPEDAIPPPWWTSPSQNPLRRPEVSNFFARYENFTRAHLPRIARPRIDELVMWLFDYELSGEIERTISECLEETFEAFKRGEGAVLQPTSQPHHSPQESRESLSATSPVHSQLTGADGVAFGNSGAGGFIPTAVARPLVCSTKPPLQPQAPNIISPDDHQIHDPEFLSVSYGGAPVADSSAHTPESWVSDLDGLNGNQL
ncbi:hypothetical protein MPH_05958 [Macrophomina phaseolina MS6]|uniref:C2H2-type domain-containing protein n=1 Tax=Macrophomina phaseolina (strain MS6) TaxID=1126212 RepID=K2SJ41_MACPH|nr:hypothetical protein MPH_05958 [Macrophomina phaseolina MS6]